MIIVPFAVLSALAFTWYGLRSVVSFETRHEYRRYGIPNLRVPIGSLQLLGAGGVMIGLLFPPLGMFSAGGLCTMMVLALLTRIRLHDAPTLMIPAASLAVLNGVLVAMFVDMI